jgi:hypothetical protein
MSGGLKSSARPPWGVKMVGVGGSAQPRSVANPSRPCFLLMFKTSR